jgi:hypothetical protein
VTYSIPTGEDLEKKEKVTTKMTEREQDLAWNPENDEKTRVSDGEWKTTEMVVQSIIDDLFQDFFIKKEEHKPRKTSLLMACVEGESSKDTTFDRDDECEFYVRESSKSRKISTDERGHVSESRDLV